MASGVPYILGHFSMPSRVWWMARIMLAATVSKFYSSSGVLAQTSRMTRLH